MNDPDNFPIAVEDMRAWLMSLRAEKGISWAQLGAMSGIPSGTLSTFATGNYGGNADNVARRIFMFKQQLESRDSMQRSALARPDFVDMPSARRFLFLLERAQLGRITAAATGPGTGKTMAAEHYARSVSNVWLATMQQSTKTVNAMIAAVLKAMGLTSTSQFKHQRSAQIIEFVRGRGGLLIIDEANQLEWAALEELRGWHDIAGLGIALLGNEELMARIRGGANRHAYARLNSRIALYHIQDMPLEADIAAYLHAMDIDDPAIVRPLTDIGLAPGSGGLREIQQILESAQLLAIGDDTVVTPEHVKAAITGRGTAQLRRAA